MSVATDLRKFLDDNPDVTITQICEGQVSELHDPDIGFIWFGRVGTQREETLGPVSGQPERQYFDLELYHPDPDTVEEISEVLHLLHNYSGAFGDGNVQVFKVSNQKDGYEQRVQFSDDVTFDHAFLMLEVISYTPT